jgi:chromate transport protein ChrA
MYLAKVLLQRFVLNTKVRQILQALFIFIVAMVIHLTMTFTKNKAQMSLTIQKQE